MPTEADYARARAFRKALEEDGCESTPLYDYEAYDRASRHEKGHWIAQVFTREPAGKNLGSVRISIWGKERGVTAPAVYSMEALEASLRTCPFCKATDVETFKVAFADRSCEACLPEARRKLETPGWCD